MGWPAASGRRIKKKVDDYTIRYLYDGGNVIAEYDINDNLLRKYIHGARVDEPVCMIDVVDSNAVYYYHFDALGSVVALSDSDGDTIQTYEYSVYGQVAAEDPNFLANPYMFTGRRFDFETGLYYYRARYYNPYIGRFLQTDPVGYGAGMNLYAYCGNNPLAFVDPFGLKTIRVDIPTICITNDPYKYSANANAVVEGWLTDVGFFDEDEYEGWSVENASLKVSNGEYFFDVILDGPADSCEPNFKTVLVGGLYKVITIDSIGRLDSGDRTLDRIIRDSIHEMNQLRRPLIPTILPGQLSIFKFAYLTNKLFSARQTPFLGTFIQKWKYKGEIYDNSEVNYILMGHGMKHQKIAHYLGVGLVRAWKLLGRGHLTLPPGVLYWFTKGYGEYGERADW